MIFFYTFHYSCILVIVKHLVFFALPPNLNREIDYGLTDLILLFIETPLLDGQLLRSVAEYKISDENFGCVKNLLDFRVVLR